MTLGVVLLQITYKNNKLKEECEKYDVSKRHYGEQMAEKIFFRIGQLRSVDTVEELIKYKLGRCHGLEGNRKKQYALDLVHPYRLVFTVEGKEVQLAKIIEIKDYH